MFVKIISFYKICTENVKNRIISGCKHHNLMTDWDKTASPHHPKNGDEGTYIYIRCNHFWQKILYSLLNA